MLKIPLMLLNIEVPPAPPVPKEQLPLSYVTDPLYVAAYAIFILAILVILMKLSLSEYHERIREFYEEGKWKGKY